MGSIAFLATLAKEILSVLRLNSETNLSLKDRRKLVIRQALMMLTALTLIMTTYRLMEVSISYAQYRKDTEELLEQCQSKKYEDGPSDSSTGLGITRHYRVQRPENSSEVCLASWCPPINQVKPEIIDEYRNRPR